MTNILKHIRLHTNHTKSRSPTKCNSKRSVQGTVWLESSRIRSGPWGQHRGKDVLLPNCSRERDNGSLVAKYCSMYFRLNNTFAFELIQKEHSWHLCGYRVISREILSYTVWVHFIAQNKGNRVLTSPTRPAALHSRTFRHQHSPRPTAPTNLTHPTAPTITLTPPKIFQWKESPSSLKGNHGYYLKHCITYNK